MQVQEGFSVQDQVEVWKKIHLEKLVDHGNQALCCVPYRCVMRLSDCAKRKEGTLHYKTTMIAGEIFRSRKPKLVNCIECNVWDYIDAHEEEFVRNGSSK